MFDSAKIIPIDPIYKYKQNKKKTCVSNDVYVSP